MRNGIAYRREPLVHLTSVTGFSLSPTPTATPYGADQSASAGANVRPSLQTMARWGLVPTPTTMSAKQKIVQTKRTEGCGPNLPEWVAIQTGKEGGYLNPQFLAWMMGFPIDWCAI